MTMNTRKDFSENAEDKVDEAWLCPLTHQIFLNPVIASNNKNYERDALSDLFVECGKSDKITLPSGEIIDNEFDRNLKLELNIKKCMDDNPHLRKLQYSSDVKLAAFLKAINEKDFYKMHELCMLDYSLIKTEVFDGKTIIEFMFSDQGNFNKEQVNDLLEVYCGLPFDIHTFIFNAINAGNWHYAIRCIALKLIGVNDQDYPDKNTLLHLAVIKKNLDFIRCLIVDFGAKTCLRNYDHKKPKKMVEDNSEIEEFIEECKQASFFKNKIVPIVEENKILQQENKQLKQKLKILENSNQAVIKDYEMLEHSYMNLTKHCKDIGLFGVRGTVLSIASKGNAELSHSKKFVQCPYDSNNNTDTYATLSGSNPRYRPAYFSETNISYGAGISSKEEKDNYESCILKK